ncbi:hypothetical protein BDR26DRAFT_1003036 [Obelidium mucronatum]|nr:hypothetical protein BDR26DRAFT_1003036 [Obelidium mucronatum]
MKGDAKLFTQFFFQLQFGSLMSEITPSSNASGACVPLSSSGPCGAGFAGQLAPAGLEAQLADGDFLVALLSDARHGCTAGPGLSAAVGDLRYQSLAACAGGVAACGVAPGGAAACPGPVALAFSSYALLFSQAPFCPSPPTPFVQAELALRKKLLLALTSAQAATDAATPARKCIVATRIEDRCGLSLGRAAAVCEKTAKNPNLNDPCCVLPATASFALLASNGSLLPVVVAQSEAASTPASASSSSSNTSIAISVAIIGGVVAALSAALFMWMRKRRQEKLNSLDSPSSNTSTSPAPKTSSSSSTIRTEKALPSLPRSVTKKLRSEAPFGNSAVAPIPPSKYTPSSGNAIAVVPQGKAPTAVAEAVSQKKNSSQIVRVKQVFQAAASDELSLVNVGDEIYVLQTFEDGWAFGVDRTRGTRGIFPLVCCSGGSSSSAALGTSPPTPTPTNNSGTELEYHAPISAAAFRRRESSKHYAGVHRPSVSSSVSGMDGDDDAPYVHPSSLTGGAPSFGRRVSSVDQGLIGGTNGTTTSDAANVEGVVAYYGTDSGIVMRVVYPYEAVDGSDELTLTVGCDLIMFAEFEDSAYGSAPTSPTWSRHEPLFSGVVMEAITASLRSIDAESMMAKLSSNTNQPESSVPKEDRGSVLDGNGLSSFGISRDSTSCPVVTIIEFGNGTASNSPTISSSASTTSSSILISRSGSPGYNPKSPATRLNSAHMERKSQQPSRRASLTSACPSLSRSSSPVGVSGDEASLPPSPTPSHQSFSHSAHLPLSPIHFLGKPIQVQVRPLQVITSVEKQEGLFDATFGGGAELVSVESFLVTDLNSNTTTTIALSHSISPVPNGNHSQTTTPASLMDGSLSSESTTQENKYPFAAKAGEFIFFGLLVVGFVGICGLLQQEFMKGSLFEVVTQTAVPESLSGSEKLLDVFVAFVLVLFIVGSGLVFSVEWVVENL